MGLDLVLEQWSFDSNAITFLEAKAKVWLTHIAKWYDKHFFLTLIPTRISLKDVLSLFTLKNWWIRTPILVWRILQQHLRKINESVMARLCQFFSHCWVATSSTASAYRLMISHHAQEHRKKYRNRKWRTVCHDLFLRVIKTTI